MHSLAQCVPARDPKHPCRRPYPASRDVVLLLTPLKISALITPKHPLPQFELLPPAAPAPHSCYCHQTQTLLLFTPNLPYPILPDSPYPTPTMVTLSFFCEFFARVAILTVLQTTIQELRAPSSSATLQG
ncbi:hypothetical protein BDV93DRAFT_529137 [Ceratobasidium sp. AG-I]|nr:hypothetical protein BDV93DRAFT_529137 [Ceratobasidium sp. AG-I]